MKLKLTAIMTFTIISNQAFAACSQLDAKGTWIAYQSAFVSALGEQHVGQCKLVVDTKGLINASTSYCEFITFHTDRIPTNGTFKVKSDCSADINLELGSFVGQVQIEKNKYAYLGRFETSTVSGTTMAVKQ
mgnify:CR=1 FL=1